VVDFVEKRKATTAFLFFAPISSK